MTEHSLSVTLKAGNDFSAPWVVVYGDHPGEVEAKLSDLEGLLRSAVSAAALLRNLHTVESNGLPVAEVTTAPAAPPAQQQGWGQQQAAAPTWSAQPAAPTGPELHPTDTCTACGQRPQYKKTPPRKSDGKQFEFWSCPNQKSKGDGHYSEFYN